MLCCKDLTGHSRSVFAPFWVNGTPSYCDMDKVLNDVLLNLCNASRQCRTWVAGIRDDNAVQGEIDHYVGETLKVEARLETFRRSTVSD